jgi:DNA-binding NarL/FixJ family response regulator
VTDTITALLVDDHALVRRGFRRLLEDDPAIAVVGEAGDGDAAIHLASTLEPDVIVMDWSMPGTNGLHAARRILQLLPKVGILMLSVHADGQWALAALKAGARGYVLKGAADLDLADAVRRVAAGEVVVDPGVHVEYGPRPAPSGELSARQHEVLKLICSGMGNPAIATRLGLSVHTVRVHRARLMRILGVHSAGELVAHAVRRRLVDIG